MVPAPWYPTTAQACAPERFARGRGAAGEARAASERVRERSGLRGAWGMWGARAAALRCRRVSRPFPCPRMPARPVLPKPAAKY